MKILFLIALCCLLISSCRQTYYIVRHAEKETAGDSAQIKNNPPLSEAGRQRAEVLKETLSTKKIGYIFSTNTSRTKTTAEPTRAYFNLVTEIYQPAPDDVFISKLRSLKKNALIVGHSNTVDDIVNKLCHEVKIPGDLPETIYDNLFVITRKGKKTVFKNLKYGRPSP